MDASELSRWTRFAAKGGIGKCTALQDCVAKLPEDLMFLKDDEITVLMQLADHNDTYLGYCEGVVGRFEGPYVRFHAKLKTPVMTKRTSSRASFSPRALATQSPVPSLAARSITTTTTTTDDDAPSPSPRSPAPSPHPLRTSSLSLSLSLASPAAAASPQIQHSASESSDLSIHALPQHIADALNAPYMSFSSGSSAQDDSSPRTPSFFPAAGDPHAKQHRAIAHHPAPRDSTTESAYSTDSRAGQSTDDGRHPMSASPVPTESSLASALRERALFDDSASLRMSRVSATLSDGVSGIGLSLLQDFISGDGQDEDEEEDASHRRSPTPSSSSMESATAEGPPLERTSVPPQPSYISPAPPIPALASTSPPRSPSPPLPPRASFHSSAPSHSHSHTHSGSEFDYTGEDWEGASDIYDNYRYSRMSVASKLSRMSKLSAYAAASGAPAADAPAPPPVPSAHVHEWEWRRHEAGRRSEDSRYSQQSLPLPPPPASASAAPSAAADQPRRVPPALLLAGEGEGPRAPSVSELGETPLLHTTFASPLSSPAMRTTSESASSRYDASPSSAVFDRAPSTDDEGGDVDGDVDADDDDDDEASVQSPGFDAPRHVHGRASLDAVGEPGFRDARPPFTGVPPSPSPPPQAGPSRSATPAAPAADGADGALAPALPSASAPWPSEKKRGGAPLIVVNPAPAPPPPPPYTPVSPPPHQTVHPNLGSGPAPASASAAGPQASPMAAVFNPMPAPAIPAVLPPPGFQQQPAYPHPAPIPNAHAPSYPQPQPQQPQQPQPQPRPRPPPQHADPTAPERPFGSSRTSLFLPHPNAPKPPPGPLSLGPMYGRKAPPPPAHPAAAASAVHVLRMAAAARLGGRVATIYGATERELAASVGPVPIVFGLEPPQNVPARMVRRTATVGAGPEAPAIAGAGEQQQQQGQQGQQGNVISRANFYPQAGTARPRSRSFSGFDSALGPVVDAEGASRSREEPVPHNPRLAQRQHAPSPLSLSATAPAPAPAPAAAAPPPADPSSPVLPPPPPTAVPGPPRRLSVSQSLTNLRLAMASPPPMATSLRQALAERTASPKPRRKPSDAVSYASSPQSPTTSAAHGDRESVASTFRTVDGSGSVSAHSVHRQRSADTVFSTASDVRSLMASPPPLARNTSLRSKLSLSALRAKSSMAALGAREDAGSVLGDAGAGAGETVQVEDMDFELVRPSMLSTSSARASEESSVHGRGSLAGDGAPGGSGSGSNNSAHFHGKGDPSAFLRTDSPAASSVSPGSRSPASSPAESLSKTAAAAAAKSGEVEAHRARELKWLAAIASTPPAQARKSKKIRKLLAEGVPASVRYQVWSHLADSKARRLDGLYAQLGRRARVARLEEIERDARECFEGQGALAEPDGPLVSLLQAYLTMVPDVQYDRGIAIIAGQLLQQSPEEDAFWIFISLMDTHLRPYFSSNATQMDVDAFLFQKAVEAADPSVAKKLFVDMAIPAIRICRPWFSSLFAESLPPDYFLRTWDIFLCEGVAFLFRIGLALVTCCRRALLDAKSEAAALALLLHPPAVLLSSSPDTLVELAGSVKLKDDDVRKQRTKMEAVSKRQTQAQAQARVLAQGQAQAISLPRS